MCEVRLVSRAHTMFKISNAIMPYAEQVTVMSRPMGQIGLSGRAGHLPPLTRPGARCARSLRRAVYVVSIL